MGAQLPLLSGGDTALDSEARVALSIRESLRARQLIIQVLPPRTVEIVVPKGMRPDSVQSFVHEHREWIRRAGRELVESYPDPEFRPTSIELTAIDRTVTVRYELTNDGRPRFAIRNDELIVFCGDDDFTDARVLLRRWLLCTGRAELKPRLMDLGSRIGLTPEKVQMRLQRTRWGSCSSRRVISVNAALLMVAPELMRYLFLHELCHLKHMSHSRRYWELVALHEPEFRQLDRRLGDCWKHMPAWLSVGSGGTC